MKITIQIKDRIIDDIVDNWNGDCEGFKKAFTEFYKSEKFNKIIRQITADIKKEIKDKVFEKINYKSNLKPLDLYKMERITFEDLYNKLNKFNKYTFNYNLFKIHFNLNNNKIFEIIIESNESKDDNCAILIDLSKNIVEICKLHLDSYSEDNKEKIYKEFKIDDSIDNLINNYTYHKYQRNAVEKILRLIDK